MATITIDVLDFNLAVTGDGPVTSAFDVSHDTWLSEAGIFSFRVPARDPRAALLVVQESVIRIYADGQPVFLGIVEEKTREIPADGSARFFVAGRSFVAELEDQDVGFLDLRLYRINHGAVTAGPFVAGNNIAGGLGGTLGEIHTVGSGYLEMVAATVPRDPDSGEALVGDSGANALETSTPGMHGVDNGPALVLAEHSAGWSLDTTNGAALMEADYYGKFAGENCLDALVLLSERSGEHWYYRPQQAGSGDRKVIWIGSTTADSGVRATDGHGESVALEDNPWTCYITDFEEIEDGYGIINRVRPYGAGEDVEHAALTIAATTETTDATYTITPASNQIDYAPAGYAKRLREVRLQFADIAPISNTAPDVIAAANQLAAAVKVWLAQHAESHKFYRMSVVQLPPDVRPGHTIRADVHQEATETDDEGQSYHYVVHDIQDDFIVLGIRTVYGNDGSTGHDLTISSAARMPDSNPETMARRLAQAHLYQVRSQRLANAYTFTHIEDFDATENALFPFWLGREVASVDQVLLRFRVDPLHSTVKTVGGSAEVDVDNISVTVDSISTTVTVNSINVTVTHGHTVDLPAHNHGIASPGENFFETPIRHDGGVPGDVVTFDQSNNRLVYTGTDVGIKDFDTYSETAPFTSTTDSDGNTTGTSVDSVAATGSGTGTGTGSGTGTGTGSGTVDLSSAITTTYGIYKDSGDVIDTTDVASLTADMTLTVNGGAFSGTLVKSATTGYFELDLTADLINATTGLPTQRVNRVEVIGTGTKMGRITAQLLIRAQVQSISAIL